METIVVGVDASPGAVEVLGWAADEAARRSSTLLVVHAYGGDPAAAHALVDQAAARVAAEQPSVVVKAEARRGHAAPCLLDAASRAELLVVGARGHDGWAGMLLGSVSHHVIVHAHCPVAVIRPGGQAGTIVVGVDGSAGADRAVTWAVAEARLRGSSLLVVHAWQLPPIGAYVVTPPKGYDEMAAEFVEQARSVAAAADPELTVEGRIAYGSSVEALTTASTTAELVVVGARGWGGFADLLLGSVGHQCAQYAHCPIVVVRG
jgi:nucleotide-binding universal stress UspA family protein